METNVGKESKKMEESAVWIDIQYLSKGFEFSVTTTTTTAEVSR